MALKDVLRIRGAKEVLICFFCYCAIEQTAGLWASSYLNLYKGIPIETAASFASMFYIGITVGRAISGFITMKLSNIKMIRMGQGLILLRIIIMIMPFGSYTSLAGFIMIGVQMAFAYMGTLAMPPLFGVIANVINVALLPLYLFVIMILMVIMHEALIKVTAK